MTKRTASAANSKANKKPEVESAPVKAAVTPADTKAVKTETKATEEKTVEVKPEIKKEAEVKKEVKKPAEAKTAEKKPAVKKTAAKKTVIKETVFLQFAGKEVNQEDLMKQVKEIWTKELKQKVSDMKSVTLYLKPEEHAAYYVINEDKTGKINL